MEIAGNTIRAFVGDGVRIVNQATNVELISNIIWSDSGYGIYVANDSQGGFWSDYNTLFADNTGKIVYWTKDFYDILDWQDDVARFDLHSDGSTIVNPFWAQPHFGIGVDGVLTPRPLVADQRLSDPTTSGGDPAGSFIGYRGVPNLLTNGSFENGLTGWTVTPGGAATSGGQVAWVGQSVFLSGTAANAVAQQTVDLVAAGFDAAAIDSGSLQVAFGGRVSLSTAAVSAQISLVFRDKDGIAIGNPVVVPAGTDLGRWLRAFDTVYVPAGARTAQFLFGVSKTDGSNGASLDAAFLGIIPRGTSVSQGNRPAAEVVPLDASNGRLALRSPDLYVDWQLNTPKFITWDSFGVAAGGAVRIELWQDGASGPAFRSVITASTPDTGRFAWTPSSSGLDYGTYGLHIRIISVANPAVYDMSTEPFTVPENGNIFYVNDNSTTGDQYTTAVGANRNDGKLASAPKPGPVNLFRTYDITAGATVFIDQGSYPLIDTLQLSGSVDRGLGLDTAFTIHGPTNPGTTALMLAANPGARPQALIDLLDADFVTLDHLTLQGGVDGLLVHGGSDTFSASYLTASGQSGNAFDITTNSPTGVLDHLTAIGAAGEGLIFGGTLQAITHYTGTGNQDGLVVSGSIVSIADSTMSNNRNYGLNLTLSNPGITTIEGNTISGNSTGAYLYAYNGGSIVFGNANLALGRGNNVFGNTSIGVWANTGSQVVGNSIHDNAGALGLKVMNGASAADNLVFGNFYGIELDTGTTLQSNRVYANTSWGISVGADNAMVIDNTVYSNAVGVYLSGSNINFRNNLIYGDQIAGLRITSGSGSVIANNTIYEPVAGTVNDVSSYGAAALDIDRNVSSVTLTDNIIVALAGVGISVANAAQAGLVSNYNLFYTGAGGRVGNWLGLDRTSLAQWRTATQRDSNSRFGDPLFVNAAGPDGNVGFGSPAADGSDDDFHVQSLNGSFHGGSLAVVRNVATGLPVFPTATLTNDAAGSPAIDRGDPSVPVGAETAPNGGIVEIGAFGGTTQASLSPAAFLTVTSPDGGETLFQGATATIKWNTFNASGTVDLAATTDGVNFTTIASGIANSGSYAWAVDGGVFAAGANYRVRVSSTADATIFDLSDQTFTISAPVHAYYINDNSTTGDQYTTAVGNDANTGLTADAPMASLQALLAKYSLRPGDTVYVDTGNYALTTNIVFTSDDSGASDTQRLDIQGPTNPGAVATFDRTSRSSGFDAFEFKGADYVTLQNLHITGGEWGVLADDNQASLGITLANDVIDGNLNGVYVGIGNSGFTLDSSALTDSTIGYGYGIYINQTDGLVTNSTFTNFATGAYLNSTTNSVLRSDTFVNDTAATNTNFVTNILFDQLNVSGGYYGISTYRATGLIQNSVVHDTGSFGMSVDGFAYSGNAQLIATGNTIYNIGGSNAYAAALTVSGTRGVATNNVIYSSVYGISVPGGLAVNNRVFGMSNFGIDVGSSGSASGNQVYDNAIGIIADGTNSTVTNNTIYDNAIGIQVNRYSNGLNNFNISNNTIVQPTGTAITLVGNAFNYDVRDNIISLGAAAIGLNAPAGSQIGYKSDYNLFDLAPGATVALWSGQAYTLDQAKTLLGLDINSFAADPQFANPVGADGIRGFVGGVDHGADDNFSLLAGSPAIDRGDPAAAFWQEPVGSFGDGSRIDIGAGGNAVNAAQSPSQLVQLLGQTGSQRYQVGQTSTITFRSDGLAAQDPVLFLNVGGSKVVGPQPWNVFQADQFRLPGNVYNNSTSNPVDTSQVDAPASVFQTFAELNYNSPSIAYQVPLEDGAYQVKLLFNDPFATAAGQRLFDIVANGTTIKSNFDIFATAGGANRATSFTFDTTATGGKGIRLDLMLKTWDVLLSGIEITRVNPVQPTWTASLDVSLDNGATWSNIAAGLALDRLGAGSFAWTPTAATAGTQGLLRITETDGTHTLTDQSLVPFMIAPAGQTYYVNDGSKTGDVYTTAVGSDANSGKTSDAPMANLASLLSLYHLQPGDTVYVDSGTYNLPVDLKLGPNFSGTSGNPIQIIGAGATTILARSGTALSTDVIHISGAHDISISNLAMTGGQDGIDLDDFSNSTNISLSGLDISNYGPAGNFSYGVYVGIGSLGFSLSGSNIHDPATQYGFGVKLSDLNNYQTLNAVVSGNTFENIYNGIQGAYNNNVTIANNTFANTHNAAISVGQSVIQGATLNVTGNVVTGGTGLGIDVSASYAGSVVVSGNTVSGISTGEGFQVLGPLLSQNNESFGNQYGYSAGAGSTSVGNRIHDNTAIGVTTRGNAGIALLIGNTIYSNPIGLDAYVTEVTLKNNLFYGNTQNAIYAEFTDRLQIENNTIDQTGGTAIRSSTYSTNIALKNNIIRISNNGKAFDIAAQGEPSFTSDWDLFGLNSGASMGLWGGIAVGTFNDWRFGTGFDLHGTTGDPLFIDPAHANYYLQPTSPGIDAGDPSSAFAFEPGNNGGRINLGFEGNTAAATQSAAQTVQVVSPNGLDKLTEGTPTSIAFRTDGISGLRPIVLINSAGPVIPGSSPATSWQAGTVPNGYGVNSVAANKTVDTSGNPLAAPAAVYADSLAAANGAGSKLTQSVAAGDGTYVVSLHFAEYSDLSIYGSTPQVNNNVRQFDIKINGVTVATNFDIFAAAGNKLNKAVVASFTVNATGGQGIAIELDTDAGTYWGAELAGLEVDQVTQGAAGQTAKVEASPDNGQSWELVAASAPLDSHGIGNVAWTPDFQTGGNSALIRVTVNGTVGVSTVPFLVATPGHDYYINDASTVGDEVTSAIGNDLNSGKTPDKPMASLEALLNSYALGPGDVVHVDTGHYIALNDTVFGQGDSGTGDAPSQRLIIQGPTDPGDAAIFDRADKTNGTAVFRFAGADYVTFANLEITGAVSGVDIPDTSSVGISIVNSSIHDNAYDGVYVYAYPATTNMALTIDHSRVFNNLNAGIELEWVLGATITNNEVFSNAYGIYSGANPAHELIDSNSVHDNHTGGIAALGSTGANIQVSNNRVFNNSLATNGYGISASGSTVLVSGNTVTGQTGSGADGILVGFGAKADGNVVSGNYIGVTARDSGTVVSNNRIFENTYGVNLDYYGSPLITNNRIYSNNKGIFSNFGGASAEQIIGNLIYANTGGAIDLSYGTNSRIIGNTIYQSVGTAISLANSAINATIEDNIIWGDVGTLLNVAANSLAGLLADYNLYYRGVSGTANAATLGAATYPSLADWQAGQASQNQHSLEGDPKFIDINGADNVLGGPDAAIGGGADDDFTPGKFSLAIDAGNAFVLPPTDLFGQPRHDDPAVANTGVGAPVYDETDAATSSFTASGTYYADAYGYASSYVSYTLPFAFNFYGTSYTKIDLSPAGFLSFNTTTPLNGDPTTPSVAELAASPIIAPFWASMDMRFGSNGVGIFVASAADHVTFRWIAQSVAGGSGAPLSSVAVTLFSDGSMRFDYGGNLNGLTPVIGVSAGTGIDYSVASISGAANLSNAASITFTPDGPKGRVYYDIGAVEFQGASSDVIPPAVVASTNLPGEGGSTDAVFTSVAVTFSEALDATSAASSANYALVAAGPDGQFDTPDDKVIPLAASYSAATNAVTLGLAAPLADGHYRLTVSGSSGILDTAGNPLDGDSNGTAGGAFVRTFFVDRSQNHPPAVADASISTVSGTPLSVTLSAADPDGDPITFGIVTQPKHGTIQNFDPVAGTFTYVPSSGFSGADTIRFLAQDNKLGQSQANLTINVAAANQPPVADPASVNAIAGLALPIVLHGYDLETPESQLALVIISQPAFGTLTVTGQNTVSYTANSTYSGADQFSFAWSDTGSPAGTPSNALTGAPATISISVITVNHPPVTQNTTVTTLENTAYVFKLADFPFSDPNDQPANSLQSVIVASLPGAGTLTLASQAVAAGQAIAPSDIAAGKLVFTPGTNGVGASYATFGFALEDNGGTVNGGLDISATATMTVAVTPINHAPVTQSATVTTFENAAYVFKVADFPFADPNDQQANTLQNVIVTSLPGAGALTLGGTSVALNQVVTAADVAAGKLVFTPAQNGVGPTYATFGFEVEDNGGTANGGVDTSTAVTMTVAVTPVNQAPTTQNTTVTTLENTAYAFKLSDFPFADPNDQPANALQNVIVTSLPGAGALTLGGTSVALNQVVAAADVAAGKLVFTPAQNGVGPTYATFGFEVEDNGGTANGGHDTSTAATMTVAVTPTAPVNQAPTTQNTTVTTLENTAYAFKLSDFPFADPNDQPANTLQDVIVTSLPAAGTLALGGQAVTAGQAIAATDIGAGNLVFTPAQNGIGQTYATFGFEVEDNGGTANGGVDTSTAATMTIAVTPTLSVTVSGTAQEGQTLSASPSGSVTGYQWQSLTGATWSNIAGASSATYLVQEADEGNQIRVHVTSSGGSADSAATSPVIDISPSLTTPVISGTAQEGQTLTATAAVANDSDCVRHLSVAGRSRLRLCRHQRRHRAELPGEGGRRRRPAAARRDLDRRRRQRHHGDLGSDLRGHRRRAEPDGSGDQRHRAGRADPDGDGGGCQRTH